MVEYLKEGIAQRYRMLKSNQMFQKSRSNQKDRSFQRYKRYLKIAMLSLLIGFMFFSTSKSKASNSHPYLIKINRSQNCITIYEKDGKGTYTVPIKAITCSTGGSNTPLGTYKTPAKYRWKLLMGGVWGQYSTRIQGGVLFHSVWYYKQDASTLSAKQYNRLGTTASHGCVRLSVEDAKWIYDHCPVGTTVIIYDSKKIGPLGKPESIIIPTTTGWDPTDPSDRNPWKNTKPVITGAKNRTITYGAKVNLLNGVSAKSSVGLYISKSIKTSGTVNAKKPGKYKVTYSITDPLGRTAEKSVTYTVLMDQSLPVLKGITDQIVSAQTTIDRDFALENITASWNGKQIKKSKIKVEITQSNDTTYKIQYSVTASNKKTVKKTSTITVDMQAPIIVGAKDRVITLDQVVDQAFALKGITASDNGVKIKQSNISVTIKDKEDHYNITYSVTDKAGNETSVIVKFIIIDEGEIIVEKEQTITSNIVVDEKFARLGVTAYLGDEEITDQIQVDISELMENKYTITYTILDALENEITKVVTITVVPNIQINGVVDKTIPKETNMTEEFVRTGITALEGDEDVTHRLSVIISELEENKYQVTYRVTDKSDFTKESIATFTVE